MDNKPFLKHIASHLLKSGEYSFPETCIVFPNKRARIYLNKYIGELTTHPVWAPEYYTINELMAKISGLIYADKLSLIFELYSIYIEKSDSKESFDQFYPYIETILSDFDEIDKYLVNADDLFQNLSNLKDIEDKLSYLTDEQIKAIQRFWHNFNPEHKSESKKMFLSIWDLLPHLYRELKSRLRSKGLAYEGMAYREVSELIVRDNSALTSYKKYLFVGFNALNTCEKKLFRHLKSLGIAEFFHDYDIYYANDLQHEAGIFIRENIREFPSSIDINVENINSIDKNIKIFPIPSNTGQTRVIPEILKEYSDKNKLSHSNTAIILADERLLLPVIYSLPPDVDEVNVTMGYPMHESTVYSLIESIYRLTLNSRVTNKGIMLFSVKDVVSVLNNPLIIPLFKDLNNKEEILNNKAAFINPVSSDSEVIITKLFNDPKIKSDTSEYLLQLFKFIIHELLQLRKEEKTSAELVQMDILYETFLFLTRINELLKSHEVKSGTDTLFRLIRKLMHNRQIPLAGEPLAGLQIMGILETRTLDFDNLIFLSMNEGVFPKSPNNNSFIPLNLRHGFGLPSPSSNDAIYAYYFYRLFQRAKNISLIYNSSSNGLFTGEQSRFLQQIIYELNTKTQVLPVSYLIKHPQIKKIIIDKNEELISKLSEYYSENPRALSPSAINNFIDCSLRFYFHYLERIPEKQEAIEEISQKVFGSIFHKSMNILYADFENNVATSELLKDLSNPEIVDKAIESAFHEFLTEQNIANNNSLSDGINLIIRQILKRYIIRMVQHDISSSPIRIKALEKSYYTLFPLNIKGKNLKLKIGGIIDRVDMINSQTRILDYKTGKVNPSLVSVASLFSLDKERNGEAFQILLYSLVYSNLNPDIQIVPGLISLRHIFNEDFSYLLKYNKKPLITFNSEIAAEFSEYLQLTLKRLFDKSEAFRQTSNEKICEYCDYRKICHR